MTRSRPARAICQFPQPLSKTAPRARARNRPAEAREEDAQEERHVLPPRQMPSPMLGELLVNSGREVRHCGDAQPPFLMQPVLKNASLLLLDTRGYVAGVQERLLLEPQSAGCLCL